MPRRPRIRYAGAFYHVFNRGVNRQAIVYDDVDRKTFFKLLAQTVREFEIRLLSYCLMTTHFHLFWQTLKANLDEAMWFLLRNYANAINERHGRVGHLFQGRYRARVVETERYALALPRYIHRNPLKAGIVTRLEDYPWSSYPCYLGILPKWAGLDIGWLLERFHPDPIQARSLLQAFHLSEPSQDECRAIEATRGTVLGSQDFKKKLKATFSATSSQPGT